MNEADAVFRLFFSASLSLPGAPRARPGHTLVLVLLLLVLVLLVVVV
jgi:hypothetical protein